MKRKIIAGAVALLLGGAGAIIVAAPASAHTPTVSASCEAITVNATAYDGTKPAEGAPTIFVEKPNPAYVPATPGSPAIGTPTITVEQPNPAYVPAVDATYVTETKYRHPIFVWVFKWDTDRPEHGWVDTGETRQVELTPAVPAQGSPTILVEVPNPAYVPEVPETPAVGTPTIVVEEANPAHVPADNTPNSVSVTVDGTVVHTAEFGGNYSTAVPVDGSKSHTYAVTITAWNDPTGSKGWTKTFTGKTTACPPVGITVPDLTVTPPTCLEDGSLPFLSNPAAQNPNGYEFPGQGFRVYLDRAFNGAGTYTATLQKVGPGFDAAFPYGTKITAGATSQTLVVLAATGFQSEDDEAACFVSVPEEETTTGEWVTGAYECGDTTVDETREVTTTTYTLNRETGEVTSASSTATEERTRDLTTAELDALECPVPTEPTNPPAAEEQPPAGGDDGDLTLPAAAEGDLAQTGSNPAIALTAGAAGVALLALGVLLLARRRQLARGE